MKDIYNILKELNELLKNKNLYSSSDYEQKLIMLKRKIDDILLKEDIEKINHDEHTLILQQYRTLINLSSEKD
jgi:hypothetical protein